MQLTLQIAYSNCPHQARKLLKLDNSRRHIDLHKLTRFLLLVGSVNFQLNLPEFRLSNSCEKQNQIRLKRKNVVFINQREDYDDERPRYSLDEVEKPKRNLWRHDAQIPTF